MKMQVAFGAALAAAFLISAVIIGPGKKKKKSYSFWWFLRAKYGEKKEICEYCLRPKKGISGFFILLAIYPFLQKGRGKVTGRFQRDLF